MNLEALTSPTRNRGKKPRSVPKPAYRPDNPLLTADEAAAEAGVAKSTWWREVKTGRMPAPIYVTAKSPRWRLSEIHDAVEAKRPTKPGDLA
jgi:predicted DNA-binding transcriptional regulator AlpA